MANDDIFDVSLVLTKGALESDPVIASISVTLSANFDAPTINVVLDNISDARVFGDRESEQQWVTLLRGEGGVYSATVALSPYSPTATYQLRGLSAIDVSGNTLFFDQNQNFLDLGFTGSQYAFSNPFSDSSSPAISNVQFSDWYRGDDGSWRIDVSLDAVDDRSGLTFELGSAVPAFLLGPTDPFGWFDYSPNGDGSFRLSGTIVANRYAASGDYNFAIRLYDDALNTYWYARGTHGDTAYTVQLDNPDQDITPPDVSVRGITGSFDPVTGRPVVVVSGTATDDLSGFQTAWFYLSLASDGSHRMISSVSLNSPDWNPADGAFSLPITLAIPFADGLYKLEGVWVDNARNDEWSPTLREILIVAPSPDNPLGIIEGTSGSEWIFGTDAGDDTISGQAGDDYLIAGGGSDSLTGGDGNDTVDGGAGNDLIVGGSGAGNDEYAGGAGRDTVKYTSALAGIGVNLQTGVARSIAGGDAAGIGTDQLSGIENVIGGRFGDVLTGNALANRLDGNWGADRLVGGAGNDTLYGGGGRDLIDGGKGRDLLIGGDAADTFRFNVPAGSANADTIRGFTAALDKIQLDDAVYPGIGAQGVLSAAAFTIGDRATAPAHRIVFEQSSGALYYDPDGSGEALPLLIATITGLQGTLSANDFIVI